MSTMPLQVFACRYLRKKITAAVQEAYSCDEDEKRKKLRQLQLRWHPDKNPVLTEFATEITAAVQEAYSCDEDEKRKKLRQLQLRWHPDKNPVLTEFATEDARHM
ncbi:uncharacterized protein HaLaN_11115 [Haematococcus lacustris]|uniref:J domain-containing protein n=1 Tax=Haematococcus lacustris TaxID=44745 RepID=A0A699YZ52_HAELA|nr:uncharacterized protein HaLaN_11115 [Haematococcus lacustris]